jgi:WD40 repeat protein
VRLKDMRRVTWVRSRARTVLLVACSACRSGSGSGSGSGAESAAPSGSAGAIEVDAAGPIQHEPGTVPSATKPHVMDAGAPAPAVPATIARLTAERSRKVDGASDATFVGKHGLVAIGNNRGVDIIDPLKGTGFAITTGRPAATRITGDESLAAVADGSGRVTVWDLPGASLRHTIKASEEDLAFSADGKLLAGSTAEGVVVWDVSSCAELRRAEPGGFGLALTPNGGEVVVSSNNVEVSAYDVRTGAKAGGGGAQTGATFGLALSPDGRFAAAGAPDGHGLQVFSVHGWGLRQLVTVSSCQEHIFPSFTSDSHLVLANGGGLWIKAFEAGSWKPYASYHARSDRRVYGVADDLSRVVVTKNGVDPVVVTVSTNAEVKLEGGFPVETFYSMSPDGSLVAGASAGVIRVWSAKTGAVVYEEHT